MTAGDRARVEIYVAVPPADAFEVFTLEIDQWWRRGPAYRVGGRHPGTMHLEPKPGGRIFEQLGAGGGALHEVGIITAWEPPSRLEFEWRAVSFVAGESTVVEVRFEPRGEGTRVTLEHRGWAAIRGDHPVRHGKDVPAFVAGLGMWWAALLASVRERAASRRA